MTTPRTLLALTAAIALQAAGPVVAQAADPCPNAALRTGPSAALPDCRAYELVSPDLNHASLGSQPSGKVSVDGNVIAYQTIDAPDNAQGASPWNIIHADRDPKQGWKGRSLSGPITTPVTAYAGMATYGIADDLLSTFEFSDQPLSGDSVPSGQNLFTRRSDGSYRLLTFIGSPFIPFADIYSNPGDAMWGNADFSHILFQPAVAQVPEDPTGGYNVYEWSTGGGTHLLGYLPSAGPGQPELPAPNGVTLARGMLQPSSLDGRFAAFYADGRLYLRVDSANPSDAHTVEAGASQRTVNPDPNPLATPDQAGVTADGSKLLFTSRSQLTNDANTGSSGGVATDAGRDLYSYDTASGILTDLTVDTADVATGANVQQVVGATSDGSYIYFTASSVLAAGAASGHTSLYVWHDGDIDFVANGDGLAASGGSTSVNFYVTPNGQHMVFGSRDQLTSYDNTDPVSGQPHVEIYTVTLGSTPVCASCRADGTRPTDDSALPEYRGIAPAANLRLVSDDGRRVFFHSNDAVVPEAAVGVRRVYEFADGKPSPISPSDGTTTATFLSASASGDDVFFASHDALVPSPNGKDFAVYDARVGGGFPIPTRVPCDGSACQGPSSQAPNLPAAATVTFGPDDSFAGGGGTPVADVSVTKSRTIRGSSGSLKVKVPGKGRLAVSGTGLTTRRSTVSKAQTVTVKLTLTSTATRSLKKHHIYKTKAKVSFSDGSAPASTATVSLTFKTATTARKGR